MNGHAAPSAPAIRHPPVAGAQPHLRANGTGAQSPTRRPRARRGFVFIGAITAMLALWVVLALIYGATAGGGQGAGGAEKVVAAVTSTSGRSGEIDVDAILATPRYFEATGRNPGVLGLDPERGVVLLVNLDTHIVDLPEPAAWTRLARLTMAGESVARAGRERLLFRADHHQTVALPFAGRTEEGRPVLSSSGDLVLQLPPLDEDTTQPAVARWELPIQYPSAGLGSPRGVASTLGGTLAMLGGLLVVFSPCALHMTGVFLPLVTGLGVEEVASRANDPEFRVRVVSLALAFVSGFVILYTAFGAAAGFAGSFFSDTRALRPYLVPLRLVAGAFVITLALQTLGFFRLPFVIRFGAPKRLTASGRRGRHLAAMLAGANVSVGCLACVGGTLLASLLLYAGASGSPVVGGATLFLFSAGMSIPFLVASIALDRTVHRFAKARRFLQYSTTVMASLMLVVGLLILSGNEVVFERLVPSVLQAR